MDEFLGYGFTDPALLRRALTHRSARNENNERLEFLGDAVLGQVVADYLYRTFPEADEGQLTRTRAELVKKDTLCVVARQLNLGEHILLGAACERQISTWFAAALKDVDPSEVHKDAKTRLQEYLQARGASLPNYTAIDVTGPAHDQQFTIECRVELLPDAVSAVGKNRRAGEQRAAALMLERLGNQPP
jgi:ribonuclease-3